jgi:hypothetical protein
MDLNDPFGRLRNRDEVAYQSLRRRLAAAGVTVPAAARQAMRHTRRNVIAFSALVLLCTLPLAILLPKLAPVTLSLAFLLLAIGLNALIKSRRFIKRYVGEELETARQPRSGQPP